MKQFDKRPISARKNIEILFIKVLKQANGRILLVAVFFVAPVGGETMNKVTTERKGACSDWCMMDGFSFDGDQAHCREGYEYAGWFPPDDLPEIPPKITIARQLIDWFVALKRGRQYLPKTISSFPGREWVDTNPTPTHKSIERQITIHPLFPCTLQRRL